MSTRACYRFIDPALTDPEVVTVYKHSDGYPDGAVCWITKALEHAWPLPRFEADEFAAAFVAANKPSAKTRRMDYIAKAERETDPERKLHLLKAAEDYGPGGRYADCVGGGVRLVNKPGRDAFKSYATDIQYLYDVTRKCIVRQAHGTPEDATHGGAVRPAVTSMLRRSARCGGTCTAWPRRRTRP